MAKRGSHWSRRSFQAYILVMLWFPLARNLYSALSRSRSSLYRLPDSEDASRGKRMIRFLEGTRCLSRYSVEIERLWTPLTNTRPVAWHAFIECLAYCIRRHCCQGNSPGLARAIWAHQICSESLLCVQGYGGKYYFAVIIINISRYVWEIHTRNHTKLWRIGEHGTWPGPIH